MECIRCHDKIKRVYFDNNNIYYRCICCNIIFLYVNSKLIIDHQKTYEKKICPNNCKDCQGIKQCMCDNYNWSKGVDIMSAICKDYVRCNCEKCIRENREDGCWNCLNDFGIPACEKANKLSSKGILNEFERHD